VKSDLIKWTVGVGAASVVTILSVLAALDARITHLDTRLSQEIREIRKEAREDRQAMQHAIQTLSTKIDALRR
jgi:hypothetical protein